MALSAPEIVARVKAGKGPQDLYSAHDAAANFARKHDEITGKIEALQRRMSGSWTGNAADQARVGAGPLLEASKVAAGHLATAQSLYLGQGDSFRGLKAEVDQNDPGPKPASTWWSDTVPFLSSRDEEIDTWNQKAQVIVESYGGYHTESSANSAGWPKEYGQLGLPPGGAGVVVQPATPPPGGTGDKTGRTTTGNTRRAPRGGVTGGQDPGHDVTGAQRHDQAPPTTGPGNPADRPLPARTPGNDSTAVSSFPSPGTTRLPGPGLGPVPTGSMPPGGQDSYLFGPAGGFGPGGGFGGGGVTGGFGPGSGGGPGEGRGGFGPKGPGGNALGSGQSTGAGVTGRPNTGRPGASSPAGRGGANGGMGAHGAGRGGHGEEDIEHQRPEYLIENDPDAAFIGELPKTVPPVIGE